MKLQFGVISYKSIIAIYYNDKPIKHSFRIIRPNIKNFSEEQDILLNYYK